MKSVLTILLTFLVLLAQAVTTLSGSIEINKINLTQLTVRYTFILDQQDSVFSADSFSSTIRCVGSSSNINLTNPVELSKTKQFLSCSNTSYKWNIVYGNTLDLGDTKFSAIGACCNLKIDASCGKQHYIQSIHIPNRFLYLHPIRKLQYHIEPNTRLLLITA